MYEGESTFECLLCGRCCTDLISEDTGVLRGLTLLPEEKAFFPEEAVAPAIGIGKSPNDLDFKVKAFQLTLETCPHFIDSLCDMYIDRPASCRQFPFSLRLGPEGQVQMGLDLNCPAIKEIIKENSRPRISTRERIEAERLLRVELAIRKDSERAWYYDLATNEWKRYDRLYAS